MAEAIMVDGKIKIVFPDAPVLLDAALVEPATRNDPMLNTPGVYPQVPRATFAAVDEAKPFYIAWTQAIARHLMRDKKYTLEVVFNDKPAMHRRGGRCVSIRPAVSTTRPPGEIVVKYIVEYTTNYLKLNLNDPDFPAKLIVHEVMHMEAPNHGPYWKALCVTYGVVDYKIKEANHMQAPPRKPVAVIDCPCGMHHEFARVPKEGSTYKCKRCGTRGLKPRTVQRGLIG